MNNKQNEKVSINTLLQGTNTSTVSASNSFWNTNKSPAKKMQDQRFFTVKYKIYTLVILALLIIVYSPIQDAINYTLEQWDKVDTLTAKINQRLTDQEDYKKTLDFVKTIDNHQSALISCINEQVACEQLPSSIIENKEAIKWYIQIGSLEKDKMQINEGKILKSVNEFMTKESNSVLEERRYNGNVTNIVIGESEELANNILQVPVTLTITFATQTHLIDFLNNLENKVFYDQTDGLNNSVLYKIQEIKYDIVNYAESQDVEVLLHAYAYKQ